MENVVQLSMQAHVSNKTQSYSRSVNSCRRVGEAIDRSINKLTNRSIGQSVGMSVNQIATYSSNQSANYACSIKSVTDLPLKVPV